MNMDRKKLEALARKNRENSLREQMITKIIEEEVEVEVEDEEGNVITRKEIKKQKKTNTQKEYEDSQAQRLFNDMKKREF